MTERRWPVKIYITWEHFGDSAPGRSFSASDRVYPDYPGFIRADIAERMAEALERSLSWLTSYPGDGALGAYEQARAALSAFRSATTEARHD